MKEKIYSVLHFTHDITWQSHVKYMVFHSNLPTESMNGRKMKLQEMQEQLKNNYLRHQ
jgi:hypothetical protein